MSSLRTEILSAFVSRTISGTQLVLHKYIFFLRKEERGGRKDHKAPWPASSQMREMCTSEVDKGLLSLYFQTGEISSVTGVCQEVKKWSSERR